VYTWSIFLAYIRRLDSIFAYFGKQGMTARTRYRL